MLESATPNLNAEYAPDRRVRERSQRREGRRVRERGLNKGRVAVLHFTAEESCISHVRIIPRETLTKYTSFVYTIFLINSIFNSIS